MHTTFAYKSLMSLISAVFNYEFIGFARVSWTWMAYFQTREPFWPCTKVCTQLHSESMCSITVIVHAHFIFVYTNGQSFSSTNTQPTITVTAVTN